MEGLGKVAIGERKLIWIWGHTLFDWLRLSIWKWLPVTGSTMTAPLLSNWWYRVAARKPKLRSHARLYRHRYRGEVWYLLQDPASSRVHRFSPSARLIIALMDGKRSIAELWEIANKHLGEDAPTQDEVIQLLGQLHSADLLESDVTPDVAELFARGEREERARFSDLRQSDGVADTAVGSGFCSQ